MCVQISPIVAKVTDYSKKLSWHSGLPCQENNQADFHSTSFLTFFFFFNMTDVCSFSEVCLANPTSLRQVVLLHRSYKWHIQSSPSPFPISTMHIIVTLLSMYTHKSTKNIYMKKNHEDFLNVQRKCMQSKPSKVQSLWDIQILFLVYISFRIVTYMSFPTQRQNIFSKIQILPLH